MRRLRKGALVGAAVIGITVACACGPSESDPPIPASASVEQIAVCGSSGAFRVFLPGVYTTQVVVNDDLIALHGHYAGAYGRVVIVRIDGTVVADLRNPYGESFFDDFGWGLATYGTSFLASLSPPFSGSAYPKTIFTIDREGTTAVLSTKGQVGGLQRIASLASRGSRILEGLYQSTGGVATRTIAHSATPGAEPSVITDPGLEGAGIYFGDQVGFFGPHLLASSPGTRGLLYAFADTAGTLSHTLSLGTGYSMVASPSSVTSWRSQVRR